MAIDVELTPPWADVLQGDELAHVNTVPARAARSAPLLLVMGHDSCGAVQASLDGGHNPPNVDALVKKIAPAAQEAKRKGLDETHTLDGGRRRHPGWVPCGHSRKPGEDAPA